MDMIVMGGLDESVVRKYLERHRRQFLACRKKSAKPKKDENASLRFVIGSVGKVTQAGMTASDLGSESTGTCLVEVLKKIEFPEPKDRGIVEVDYRFVFP